MPSAQIAVIGGGLAGLTAARALVGRGREVVLFERDGRPGGRAISDREKSVGYEPGAHLLSTADGCLLDLVAGLGLEDLLPLRPVVVAQPAPGGPTPIDATSLRGLSRIPGVRGLDALRLMRLGRLLRRFGTGLDPLAPERAAPQDDRSVADFSRLYFGRSVLENWIAPWIAELAFGDVQETSRVLALLLLARRRFAIPGTLRGDLSRVAEACAAKLPARLGVPVTAIEPGPGAGFLVHHRGGDGEATTEAEAIVLALPAPDALQVARAVLSPAEAEVLGATRYQAALSLAVGLDAPLFPAPTRVRIPPGQSWPLVSLTAEPGVAGGRVPEGQGLAILVSPASPCQLEASDEATSTRLLPYLDRIWPAAGARVGWTRLHRHGLGLPLFGVGRYRALAQLQRVETGLFQEGRRIALAGDYRVAPTLEGAVVSGMRAAAMIEPIRDSAFAPGPRASGRG